MTNEPPSPRGKNIVMDIVPYARVALEGGSCSRGKRKGGRDAAVVRGLHPEEPAAHKARGGCCL